MVEADAGHLGEGDGEEGEVDALDAKPEAEPTHRRAEGHADEDGDRQPGPRPDAEAHEEGGGDIGAEPDIERVAKRQQAGEAHHHVPRLPDIGEPEDEHEH